jgi:fructose-specific component phosphotransferase system IIB-like protein
MQPDAGDVVLQGEGSACDRVFNGKKTFVVNANAVTKAAVISELTIE